MIPVRININNEWHKILVEPGERLIDTLRDRFFLTGTKEGCGEGQCGTCTINFNGKAAPIIETIMIGTQSQQGISFTSRGEVIHEKE